MNADDPRHGTPAGSIAHRRAGQEPCPACRLAKSRADKRVRVLGSSRVPLGAQAWAIVRDNPIFVVARASGVSECALENIRKRNGDLNVYVDTKRRILNAQLITDEGLRRRVRALSAIGWSARQIAREAGVNVDNIIKLRDGRPRRYVRSDFQQRVIAAYERLHMTPPKPSRWVTAQVQNARRKGWPPPLAWDDIDSDAEPHGLPYEPRKIQLAEDFDPVVVMRLLEGDRVPSTAAERAEALAQWVADGGTESELCRWHGWKAGRYGSLRLVREGVA